MRVLIYPRDFGINTSSVHTNHTTSIVDPGAPIPPRGGAGTGLGMPSTG